MKKVFVLVLLIISIGLVAESKSKEDFVVKIGTAKGEIHKNFGKPDINTFDWENTETEIYKKLTKIPIADIVESKSNIKGNEDIIFTVKYSDDKVKSFGYMTTYMEK